ncbi:MAG: SDR family oxidoreductase [Taibaiella sp.]|nr:SDR family oxidoreductase [Taibaiella sp.]
MPNAIITGATQGIGKAICEKFLSQGFSLAVCARTSTDLDLIKQEWQIKYPSAVIAVYTADLANKEQAIAFGKFAIEQLTTVDILVNNAGSFFPGNLADEPEGHLEHLMEVNVYSAYHITRAVLPIMKIAGAGHIFNMCSVASLHAYPNGGAYSITKYALLGFSDNLRLELMNDNIRVTAISPGATYSRSWQASGLPAERFMQPSDIADMIWAAYNLSASAVVEHIVMRPMLGDL